MGAGRARPPSVLAVHILGVLGGIIGRRSALDRRFERFGLCAEVANRLKFARMMRRTASQR